MVHALFLQAAMTVLVAAIAAVAGGAQAALSAAIGGLACLLPSALFAWRLAWASRRPGGATVHGFFVGELAKVAATILILGVAARVDAGLEWPAMIFGLIAVLKSYFLMFLFGHRR